jgi:signal peptidase I
MEKPESNENDDHAKYIKEAKAIFFIIAFVLVFRSIAFEPFRIPSGSMIPTLMIGDFILVNKMAYGLKIPFSDMAVGEKINLNPIYLTGQSNPERGDVVVFKYPKEPSINYIKRVIGLPGDTLEIKNHVVYINDRPISSTEIDGKVIMDDMDDKFRGYNLKFFKTETGKHTHLVQFDHDNVYKVDHQKTIIPPGKFFMMGDNRDFSYDSRYWGFVSKEQIRGKALMIWFSFIFPFGENRMRFRPNRIGSAIN